LLQLEQGAHGVVVSHPLSMREALGSIPSVSTAGLKAACVSLRTQCAYDCNIEELGAAWASTPQKMSGRPESNQGPSDRCKVLQSDALPTEL
jgi:hypothetical protein